MVSRRLLGDAQLGDNLMDIEFLPSGCSLMTGRNGLIKIADTEEQHGHKYTSTLMSSYTFTGGEHTRAAADSPAHWARRA